jgi:hypothetical protein
MTTGRINQVALPPPRALPLGEPGTGPLRLFTVLIGTGVTTENKSTTFSFFFPPIPRPSPKTWRRTSIVERCAPAGSPTPLVWSRTHPPKKKEKPAPYHSYSHNVCVHCMEESFLPPLRKKIFQFGASLVGL